MRKRIFLLIIIILPFLYACEDESEEIQVETIEEEKSGFATMSASTGAAMRSGNEYN